MGHTITRISNTNKFLTFEFHVSIILNITSGFCLPKPDGEK
jgi:hypothetical protein